MRVKSRVGLYRYCDSKMKAKASANMLLEGLGDVATPGMGKG